MVQPDTILLDEFKERELEVLGLIAEGLSNKEIAEKLFIAVSTVRWHNRQIYSKLGVHSRTLAVAMARELGLLDTKLTQTSSQKQSRPLFVENTSFIGREREIATASQLLLDARLLTLTGPGGSGKTRLSLKLAQHLQANYPDGIYFVPLAPIRDARLVGTTIAGVLTISEVNDEPIEDILIKELVNKQILLIIDNFEHVMSAVPLVSKLLKETSNLQIIVTSREVLRIYGEQEYPVPPLQVPARNEQYHIQKFKEVEAVKLFIERAKAVKSDFSINEDSTRDIARICIYLDGLPLAIELVASHSKFLSPAQMIERMEQGFDLLSRGSRDAPARQRTLNATIDWSFELLNEDEKHLFRQLSIFDGGMTLDAVEAICETENSFDVIGSLFDKSLLSLTHEANNEPRFYMLETIRQYAKEKFLQVDDGEQFNHLMQRFSDYYVEFAEYAGNNAVSHRQQYWLNRIYSEMDNFRATLRWSLLPTGEPAVGFKILGGLGRSWYMLAHMIEGLRWSKELFQYSDDVPENILPAAYNAIARLKREVGDNEAALRLHEKAITIARRTKNIYHLGYGISNQVTHMTMMGQLDYEDALNRMNEAIILFERIENDRGLSDAHNNRGEISRYFGDFETAYKIYTQAGDLARKTGNLFGLYANAVNKGFVALKLNQLELAREHFIQTMQTASEILPEEYTVNGIVGMMGFYTIKGQYELAALLAGGVRNVLKATNTYLHPLEQSDYESFLKTVLDNLSEEQFQISYEAGTEKSLEELVAYALES